MSNPRRSTRWTTSATPALPAENCSLAVNTSGEPLPASGHYCPINVQINVLKCTNICSFSSDRCHRGNCPSCLRMRVKRCRCGAEEKEVKCSETFTCDLKCKRIRDCERHTCNKKCCRAAGQGACPPCDQVSLVTTFWYLLELFLTFSSPPDMR